MEKVDCEVLIVGGGIAALSAAIEAKKITGNVLIVSKTKLGLGGCSLVTGGFMNGVFREDDSIELFSQDVMKSSCNMAEPRIVKIFSERAKDKILELEELGVNLKREDGKLLVDFSGGNSVPRTVKIDPIGPGKGMVILKSLLTKSNEMRVKFLERYTVVKILTDDERASSAIAFNGDSFIEIRFKSIILATGGAGGLYKNTTNTIDVVGDGHFLAVDAGASLVDMEFIQFFPTVALDKYLLAPYIFSDGAVLINKNGEKFMERYDPILKDNSTRDKMARAIFTEIIEGRGIEDGVEVDYKKIPKQLLNSKYRHEIDYFMKHGVDITKQNLLIRPACHFFMGGVRINEKCETEVKGLYVCGECAGGLHGANRIGGNALPAALVFGEIAGRSAAEYSMVNDFIESNSISFMNSIPREGNEAIETTMIDYIQNILWTYIGIVRNEAGISKALHELGSVKMRFNEIKFTSDTSDYFRLRNALFVAEAIAIASFERKESRGSHYRSDYPEEKNSWKKNIIIKKDLEIKYLKR
jgi:fumarate reductase (CoM/CoB) subunit A